MSTSERVIHITVEVPCTLQEAWDAWTTNEGALTFFAPSANIELRIGGSYELLFILSNPEGAKGSEGMKILSYDPLRMLSFQWNAPPDYPEGRNNPNHVCVYFNALAPRLTKVTLRHLDWKEGEQWDMIFEFFDLAWPIIMARLKKRFEDGPIDWDNPWFPEE